MSCRVRLAGFVCLSLLGCGPKNNSRSTVAELHFTIPNTHGSTEDLVLDGFLFDSSAVDQKTLHINTLSPGVHEITAEAPAIGELEFAIRDLSNYYGFGERFDRLD
ncbi:MAG: hypothetical protein ACRD4E_17330, partial [Bryobacteraceae bacterium]